VVINLKSRAFDFLMTVVINKNTGHLIFLDNHGYQPLIPGDKGLVPHFNTHLHSGL
jgi:hypothetical protein